MEDNSDINLHNCDTNDISDPTVKNVHAVTSNDDYGRTYARRRNTLHYRTSSKRLSRKKSRIEKRRQEKLKHLENISQKIVTNITNDEIETVREITNDEIEIVTEITNNEVAEKNNADTNDNTMQVDEQACEDVIMYEQLTAMGLEINSNEARNVCTLQKNDLQKIFESGNESK